jgi:hypothetical protein
MTNQKLTKLQLVLEKIKELELIKNLGNNLSSKEKQILNQKIKLLINKLQPKNI